MIQKRRWVKNMQKKTTYDAIVIGSGPNGLGAAITLAKAGLSVAIFEAKNTIGGGLRSAELTLPGFIHDVCSAVHPLGLASPFFRSLSLEQHGVEWIHPTFPLAHPFDEGRVAILKRSIEETSLTLGVDSKAYRDLLEPLVKNWESLIPEVLRPFHFPEHPLVMARFGFLGIRSAMNLAEKTFEGELAKGFFAGLAAHSILPLERPLTAAFALILSILGHAVGWPIPRGGSQTIATALNSVFQSYGGEIITGVNIESIDQLPPSRAILCDVTPRQLLKIAGHHLPAGFKQKLERYRYGPGAFKVDWALSRPIPWKSKECALAGTVHLGGTIEEIAKSEREIFENKPPEKPFVILAQQSLFDDTRAPKGKQTAWAYCHVPNGSTFDMRERIESQIERCAPGFSDCILGRSTMSATELEQYNPNYVGGDINGGIQDIYQLFTRPTARLVPYSTPVKGLYICSSSTPPGGGVHGMCGYNAAKAALRQCF